MQLKFKRLTDTATVPRRESAAAAGFDLFADEATTLIPGQRKTVSTGIAMQLPDMNFGSIRPRSGMAVLNGIDTMAGVIDADYTGEIKVVLINHGDDYFHIHPGMRIAQLIIQPHCSWLPVTEVGELSETERGANGFGSTGQ